MKSRLKNNGFAVTTNSTQKQLFSNREKVATKTIVLQSRQSRLKNNGYVIETKSS